MRGRAAARPLTRNDWKRPVQQVAASEHSSCVAVSAQDTGGGRTDFPSWNGLIAVFIGAADRLFDRRWPRADESLVARKPEFRQKRDEALVLDGLRKYPDIERPGDPHDRVDEEAAVGAAGKLA